jgi:hypothetical protein
MFLWNILNGYFQAVAPRWQDATASYPTVLTKSIGLIDISIWYIPFLSKNCFPQQLINLRAF